MKLRVKCYAGRKEDERPVRFQLGERDYMIEEIVDQWYSPDDAFFKVRTDDGNLYIQFGLVGGEVIQNDVDLAINGLRADDLLQECNELLAGVARRGLADERAASACPRARRA